MIPYVTLQELADFLMALPDDEPINMVSGDYNDSCGCLMTKYGKSMGWKFSDCHYSKGWFSHIRPIEVMATIEGSIFNLFNPFVKCTNSNFVQPWKDHLKEEYRHQ